VSTRHFSFRKESWPIRGTFRIARGAKREAEIVFVSITAGAAIGCGECVPYARYGESADSVLAQIESARGAIEGGMSRAELQTALPPGAARNALDCALIDLEAKETGTPAHVLLELPAPIPCETAFTLSLDSPDAMAQAAGAAAARGHKLLKLKVAGEGDIERVSAVRSAAPGARLIVDANEGWQFSDLTEMAGALAELGVALIEQPLKAGEDGALHDFVSPVPLCADESCHIAGDLPGLLGRYQCVNVKLDKAGGLTEALALTRSARDLGLSVMVGCMVSTSLSMAPALLLAGRADYVDLDGPLLLERDRIPGLTYRGGLVYPPGATLWG